MAVKSHRAGQAENLEGSGLDHTVGSRVPTSCTPGQIKPGWPSCQGPDQLPVLSHPRDPKRLPANKQSRLYTEAGSCLVKDHPSGPTGADLGSWVPIPHDLKLKSNHK